MTKILQKYKMVKKFLAIKSMNDFVEAGLINETTIRNCRIIEEYLLLRRICNHLSAIEKLSDKYHLSEDSIISILYR